MPKTHLGVGALGLVAAAGAIFMVSPDWVSGTTSSVSIDRGVPATSATEVGTPQDPLCRNDKKYLISRHFVDHFITDDGVVGYITNDITHDVALRLGSADAFAGGDTCLLRPGDRVPFWSEQGATTSAPLQLFKGTPSSHGNVNYLDINDPYVGFAEARLNYHGAKVHSFTNVKKGETLTLQESTNQGRTTVVLRRGDKDSGENPDGKWPNGASWQHNNSDWPVFWVSLREMSQ